MSNKAKNPVLIPFGEWRPDTAHVNTPFLSECSGVRPTGSGYAPLKDLAVVNANTITGTALDGVATGFGQILDHVAGTATKLWQLPTALAWVDISRVAGGAYTATYWSMARFGTILIMVNGTDAPQKYTIGSSSAATALSGSPPTFRFVATCGDFLFGLGTGSSDAGLRTIRWSAIDDPESWTVGTALCDEQVFPDGGEVLGAIGDKQGYIIQRDAIRRFRFLPGDLTTIFEFEKIEGLPGCVSHYAWAVCNNVLYYVSHSGVVALSEQGFRMIGVDRVDEYFATNYAFTKRATADPFSGRVSFPISSILSAVYDTKRDRWSLSQTTSTVQTWLSRLDATTSTLKYPLAVISTGALHGLSGSNQQATITTAPLEFVPARRAHVNGVRADTDAAASAQDITITPYETLNSAGTGVSSPAAGGETTTGEHSLLVSARYMKTRLVIDAGTTYTYANGVRLWPLPDGDA